MVSTDQTSTFQNLVTTLRPPLPTRSKSPFRTSSPSRSSTPSSSGEDVFLKEAYQIHSHLSSLQQLLTSIRKPYLSLTAPPLIRQHRVTRDEEDGLKRWEGSKYLSDREREEIDLRGRMILRSCKERVGVLEGGERDRQQTILPPKSRLYTLLPSLAPQPSNLSTTSTILTAHRASILWTLNDLLAKTSGTMITLQEERAKRRGERDLTLGSQASREAAIIASSSSSSSYPSSFTPTQNTNTPIIPTNEPPIETLLSPFQIQQFESENNTLLTHMSSQLTSVLAAEKSLLEISQLQSELVGHLVQQTEVVEQLYDQAIGSVGDVRGANTQLKMAVKRGGEGRVFLLVFLLGASAALLFLDWYA